MKFVHMILTASMLFALFPLATAEEVCSQAGATEAIQNPLNPHSYLFIDMTQPDKVGEWLDTNHADGLQTVDCFHLGILRFRHDTQQTLLG